MPSGRNTARRPKKNTNVIRNTFRFSLKIEPKYDGNKTVMQQGANSAAIPAINAVISDASLITAFIAGIAALFAPCCITVLLPSYLGSIFREKRKVFLMTFVFFLGLLAVFLPLGMGAAGLGKLFSRYHDQI